MELLLVLLLCIHFARYDDGEINDVRLTACSTSMMLSARRSCVDVVEVLADFAFACGFY